MTWWQKFRIWAAPMSYSHSEKVDEWLEALMAEGEVKKAIYDFRVEIEFHGQLYAVHISFLSGTDLCSCEKLPEHEDVYRWLCPSRKVKVRFWEWLESEGYDALMLSNKDISDHRIASILNDKEGDQ